MNIEVNNKYNNYIYFDKESNLLHKSIWSFLTLNRIRKANLSAHVFNTSFFVERPDQYEEVIKGLIPIPPRSRWLYNGQNFTSCNNASITQEQKADFDIFLKTCSRLVNVIKRLPIGVDLSGGLDTSIIIGILEQFNITPVLIGMKTSRYEFRTESVIQNIFSNKFKNVILLDAEKLLPYSNLKYSPLHQLPSCSSLSYSMANQLALKYKENGIKIVFNGNGADALFCDYPIKDGDKRHPESWFTWMMDNNWMNEYVFNNYGINYKPAASKLLMNIIWTMRKDEKDDFKKLWARRLFSNYLPKELVNYTYKSDYIGLYIDGLWNAKNEISEIFKVAYEITQYEEFKKSSLDSLLNNLQGYDDKQEKLIGARISFANWIYGLARDNFNYTSKYEKNNNTN